MLKVLRTDDQQGKLRIRKAGVGGNAQGISVVSTALHLYGVFFETADQHDGTGTCRIFRAADLDADLPIRNVKQLVTVMVMGCHVVSGIGIIGRKYYGSQNRYLLNSDWEYCIMNYTEKQDLHSEQQSFYSAFLIAAV